MSENDATGRDGYIPEYKEDIDVHTEKKTVPPSMYNVLILNDDYTTMEFVVRVLEEVFHKSNEQATQIMLHVHRNGVGLCGCYIRDIAETKVITVNAMAQENGFPLKCVMEAL